jgi:hypothetical protein
VKTYRVTQNYSSGDQTYVEGQLLELDDDTAAWMLRDVPGSIVPAGAAAPVNRVVEAAPADRMVKAVGKKRSED